MNKQFDLSELLNTFHEAELKKLAEVEAPAALQKLAESQGHRLSEEESELLFATLNPQCGNEPIDDENLEVVAGGELPDPPKLIWRKAGDGSLSRIRPFL